MAFIIYDGGTKIAALSFSTSENDSGRTVSVSSITFYNRGPSDTIVDAVRTTYSISFAGYSMYSNRTTQSSSVTLSNSRTVSRTTYQQTVELVVDVTHEYRQNGSWYTSRSGSGSQSFTVAALQQYSISYSASGGSGAPSPQTFYKGDSVTVSNSTPTRSGYTFSYWSASGGLSGICTPGEVVRPTGNVTLTAQWAENPTLSYNANGGSGAPSSQTVSYGTSATVAYGTPTRQGYKFLGWSTSSSATDATYTGGDTIYMRSDTTLYAVWQARYLVSYNANGGSGAPGSVYVDQGSSTTISYTTPTRGDYAFCRWNTNSSGTGTWYAGGDSVTPDGDLTLYAIWNPRISFSASGCANVPATQTKTFGVAFTLPATTPSKDGYAFVRWNTASDGSGTGYAAGGTVAASMNTSMTLYAILRKTAASPTISSISIVRTDSGGSPSDDGGYAKLTVRWSVDTTTAGFGSNKGRVTATLVGDDGTSQSATLSNGTDASGTSTHLFSGIDTDGQYTVTVTVTNTVAEAGYAVLSTSRSDILTRAEFIMDFRVGGKAIGFGSAAPQSGFECGWDAQFDGDVNILGDLAASNLTEYEYTSGLITTDGNWGCSYQHGWSCWHLREVVLVVTTSNAVSAGSDQVVGTLTSGTGEGDGHDDFTGNFYGSCTYGAVAISSGVIYISTFRDIPANSSVGIVALYRGI